MHKQIAKKNMKKCSNICQQKDVKLTKKYVTLHSAVKQNIIQVIIHCWQGYGEPVFSYIAGAQYSLIELM